MANKKRPCKFEIPGNRRKFPESKILNGVFHRFGDEVKSLFDADKGLKHLPYTVAIVEDEDGNIHKIDPEQLQFLDK